MSQQYTEVTWQDETTTTQGTLINAERLNQMQQAHHYADGFKEVDAVPVDDPGTDYHQVVYCTADTTFYRWDGAQWTADVDDDTKRLLLEHEADTANPHAVTKAQVGLGNVDNTADADKPVSTATQTALDGKADKATTLAGYGITDAYTKAEADTLLAAKADDSAVVHLAGAETISGAKTFTAGATPILMNAGNKGFNMVGFVSDTKLNTGATPVAVERHGLVLNDADGNMAARLWFDLEPGSSVIKLRLDGQVYDATTQTVVYKSVVLGTLAP